MFRSDPDHRDARMAFLVPIYRLPVAIVTDTSAIPAGHTIYNYQLHFRGSLSAVTQFRFVSESVELLHIIYILYIYNLP